MQFPNWIYVSYLHCRSLGSQALLTSCRQSFPNFFQIVFLSQRDYVEDQRCSFSPIQNEVSTIPSQLLSGLSPLLVYLIVKHKSKNDIKAIVFSTGWQRSITESRTEFLQTTYPPDIQHVPPQKSPKFTVILFPLTKHSLLLQTHPTQAAKNYYFKTYLKNSLQNNPTKSIYQAEVSELPISLFCESKTLHHFIIHLLKHSFVMQ